MTGQKQDTKGDGDGALERRAKAAFDESVDALDAAALSRLNRARQRALEELPRRRTRTGWLPAAATAALAVAVFAVWIGREPALTPGSPGTPAAPVAALGPSAEADDLEILLAEDSLEMLEELEFYDWVAHEELDGAGGSGGVG